MNRNSEKFLHKIYWLLNRIEEYSLPRYVWSFVGTVIVFGVAYSILTPLNHGLGSDFTLSSPDGTPSSIFATIPTGIYFSVVTMSSLGYGDIYPLGFSKILVIMEVVIGLFLIGMIIARLTSRRLMHFVSRVFISTTQQQLEKFRGMFDSCCGRMEECLPEISRIYQPTPGNHSRDADMDSRVREEFGTTLKDLKNCCRDLKKYLHDETAKINYFEFAPSSQVIELAEAVEEAFFLLGQGITSLPLSQRGSKSILNNDNVRNIMEAIQIQKEICGICDKHAVEESTLKAFKKIDKTCRNIPMDFFPVLREQEGPDQMYSGDPQVANREDSDE